MKIEADMRLLTKGNFVAVGSVILDGIIKISNVKVINFDQGDGKEHWKVLMPRKKKQDGWSNIINVKSPELLQEIESEVYKALCRDFSRDYEPKSELDVKVVICKKNELLGYANITYGHAVEISGIQIRGTEDNIRVVFPYSVDENKIDSLVEPMTADTRAMIKEAVTEAYQNELKKGINKERGRAI